MPRYYCDYCDTYLTHDSPSVRKQHNSGYKHKANVRTYYQQFEEQQTQSLIDQKVKEHLGQAGYPQVGAAFHQHLTAFGGQYRPPIPLPLPVRPLVLPRPAVPSSGYMAPPGVRPPTADANGFPRPQTLMPPGASDMRTFPPSNVQSSSGGAPSNGPYPNASTAPPGPPTQYSTQQPFRPMAPSGQPTTGYGYGQQSSSNGYSGTTPVAVPRYNS